MLIKKYSLHIIGFIMIAFGVSAMIIVNFGLAPVDAFNLHVYKLVNHPYIEIGTVSIITSFLIACFIYLFERKKDIIISFALSVILGLGITLFTKLLGFVDQIFDHLMVFRIVLFMIGVIVLGIGVVFTVLTKLPASPFERLMVFLNKKTGKILYAKLIVEVGFFVLALLVGFLIDREERALSLFSILYVLMMPLVVAFFMKLFERKKNEIKRIY